MGEATEWGEVGLRVLSAAAAEAPRQPGVYFFLDDRDEVLYVGKARSLRQRLRQHAATKAPETERHRKYDLVRRVVWDLAADDEAAAWREEDLIFALRPLFNGVLDPRRPDLVRKESRVGYIVVTEVGTETFRLTLEHELPRTGRAYGCFPHLGKGMGSRLGVACSDGYTALLRLLWASGQEPRMPTSITRSPPPICIVNVSPEFRDNLHRFLSGTRARLADELLRAASHRPDVMQPALRRDRDAALRFFAGGPKLVRERRLRHGVRSRVLDVETYRRLVEREIAPVITGVPRVEEAP